MKRSGWKRWAGTGAIALGITLTGPHATARAATAQQVQQAIQRAQKYILSKKNADGNWEEVPRPLPSTAKETLQNDVHGRQWGGLTALATYALLASGVDQKSDELAKPKHFLLTANIQGIYALGISSQLVLFLPEKETREFARRNLALLYGGMWAPPAKLLRSPQQWTDAMGFYGYWTGTPEGSTETEAAKAFNPRMPGTPQPVAGDKVSPGWFDHSSSQYAVLGMWAMAENGAEIRNLYWEIEDAAWKRAQLKDGSWNYDPAFANGVQPSPSMTAAGIATLFITQDFTQEENWGNCRGGIRNEYIERGLGWMDQHINEVPGNLYAMYGVERIGTASGRRYFGTKDWYQMGADYLIAHQNPDGSWRSNEWQVQPLSATSFALLFLSRGRAPVMVNKLQYEPQGAEKAMTEAWNERPRDIANLAKWAGKQDESYYNWQVVNLNVPAEELHDAPILYISGSVPLKFTDEEEAKLRAFAEQGGLILGNADCGKEPFSKSFQDLGRKLFPKYQWRQVGPTDFLYTEQFKDKMRAKPKVLELTNGVRKLMVLIPDADPGKAWQTRSRTNPWLFGLGANVFLYATDRKNLFTKDDSYWVTPNPAVPAGSALSVARLDVGPSPDPEPAGWVRMNAIMHNRFHTDLKVDFVKPEAAGGHQVAHLTGTGKFALTPAERSALKQFVDAGGTLIADAAGGDVVFADCAENELSAAFGGKFELLPDTHLVYNYPGDKIDHVGWRSFAIERVRDRQHAKLKGITVGNRTAVFLSREDLSAGIVGEPVDGILGYDPATATNLMAGMLLYAQNHNVAPAVAPAIPAAGTVPGAPPAAAPGGAPPASAPPAPQPGFQPGAPAPAPQPGFQP